MAELSRAARAALHAFAVAQCLDEFSTVNDPPCHPSDSESWNGCHLCVKRPGLAAALRALANHVSQPHRWTGREPVDCWFPNDQTRRQLRRFANELENLNG